MPMTSARKLRTQCSGRQPQPTLPFPILKTPSSLKQASEFVLRKTIARWFQNNFSRKAGRKTLLSSNVSLKHQPGCN